MFRQRSGLVTPLNELLLDAVRYEADVVLEVGEADRLAAELVQVGEEEGGQQQGLQSLPTHPAHQVYLGQPGTTQRGIPAHRHIIMV